MWALGYAGNWYSPQRNPGAHMLHERTTCQATGGSQEKCFWMLLPRRDFAILGLGEARGKELQPLLGILDFIVTCFCCPCLWVCRGGCFYFDMKGIGTPRPSGEAQGKELQPLLGILDFIVTYFCCSCLCVCRECCFYFDMKGIGTSRPVGEAQGKLKGSRGWQGADVSIHWNVKNEKPAPLKIHWRNLSLFFK